MQHGDGCWWFGEPGQCRVYITLIATLAFCAVCDLFMTVSLVNLSSDRYKNTRCDYFRVHSGCLTDPFSWETNSFKFMGQYC